MMNKDLYLKQYSDGSWELYNKDSLELCSASAIDYLEIFKEATKDVPIDKPLKVLIVGGGDKQLYYHLAVSLHYGSKFTIVDPLVGDYSRYQKYYVEAYPKGLINLSEHKMIFSEAEDNLEIYDLIIVDCSEEILEETKEIYCEDFMISLKELSHNKSEIYFYVPPNKNNHPFSEVVTKHFSTDYVSKYIPAWSEDCIFLKLKPYENTLLKHVHFHSNLIFFKDENEHLKNLNHEITFDFFFNIVSKYCSIMRSESHPFETGGFSGSFILGESHFNWHSYPELNLLTVDFYHCNYNEGLMNIFAEIKNSFSIESLKSINLTRNIFNPLSEQEPEDIVFYTID